MVRLLTFEIEERQYALHLESVERVVRAVEVSLLPGTATSALGIINVEGRMVPVINMRRRLGLPERDIELTDHFIIARTGSRTVALIADRVKDVVAVAEDSFVAAEELCPGAGAVSGAAKLPDGLALVHDVSDYFSAEEETALQRAFPSPAAAPGACIAGRDSEGTASAGHRGSP